MDFGVLSSSFFVGAALAALLLLAGLALGLWAGQRLGLGVERSPDSEHVLNLVGGLVRWTNGIAGDVSDYQAVLNGVAQRMDDATLDSPDDRTTNGLVHALVEANDLVRLRLENAEEQLQHQAHEIAAYMSEARTDALTGLPNRRTLDDELSRRLAELRRHHTPFAVLMADIDHFKLFNDRYGHLAGDAVLGDVARQLKEATRESDIVCRYGGEEFAAVLPVTEGESARDVAERIRATIESTTFYFEKQRFRVTISAGVTSADANDTLTGLLQRVDHALYASKNAGRNFVHWHDGTQAVPITRITETRMSSEEADQQEVASELNQACDDLRQKLSEISEALV